MKHGKRRQQPDTWMGFQKSNLSIACSAAFEFDFEGRNPRLQLIDQSKRMFTLDGIHADVGCDSRRIICSLSAAQKAAGTTRSASRCSAEA